MSAPDLPPPPAARPEPTPRASEFELQEEPKPSTQASLAPPPVPSAPLPPSAAAPSPVPKPEPVNFLPSPAPVVPSAPPPLRSEERPAFSRSDTRPAFEPPLSPDERQPILPPEDAAERAPGRITTREWKALGTTGLETERLADRPRETASAARPKPSAPVPAGPKKSGRGWVLALLVVLAVAAGVAYVLRDFLFSNPATRPENPVGARPARPQAEPPTPAPAVPTPTAATSKSGPASKAAAKAETKAETKVTAAPAPTTPAPRPAGSASGRTKGSLIVSREWTGKPAIWVIHFSSHKDRAGAEKEAARLAAALGKTGRAIEVDLGEKGIWYRVLIGDFPTQDEARAYRTELEVKNTPNLGFVYQLKGE